MSNALTDVHVNWVREFTGIDTSAGQAPGNAGATDTDPSGAATAMDAPGGPASPAPASAKQPPVAKKAPDPPANKPTDEDAARVKALADRIPIRVDVFLNTWLISVTQAIDEVPPPKVDDPSATGNFYRALGGNMMWAATSLIPEVQPVVVMMSFVGAAIGSGAGSDPAADQPPAPTKELHTHVDMARDALTKAFRAKAATLAADIVKSGAKDVDAEDHALWDRIFNKLEFNSIQALKAQSVAMVTSAVKQYTDQWNAWTTRTNKEADTRTAKILSQTAGGRMPAGFPQTIRNGQLKAVRQENPFGPKLTF